MLARISGIKISPNMGFMQENTANNTNFHCRTNSIKIYDQIFQKIQKTLLWALFWSIFQILLSKENFYEKCSSVMHNLTH